MYFSTCAYISSKMRAQKVVFDSIKFDNLFRTHTSLHDKEKLLPEKIKLDNFHL